MNRPGPPLTAAQAAAAARLYPYAMAMANRRAARFGRRGRARLEAYRDLAADELLRCVAAHRGVNGASCKHYSARSIALGLRNVDRRWRDAGPRARPAARPGPDHVARVDAEDSFEALVVLLHPRYREVVRLFYRDDLALAEIGDRLGITRQGAFALKERALARLRSALAEKERAA